MSERLDTVVIGAGVVGLAVARELASAGREVVVLEKNARVGEETSSRNSEVIHAGLYYPTASLKARLCVAGKAALYAYCADKGVDFARCGKVVVAFDERQAQRLAAIERQAAINGVHDLERLDGAALERLEPDVRGVGGLLSPSTGIIDVHALMLALQGDLEAAGGMVALRAVVDALAVERECVRVAVLTGGAANEIEARLVVNAAGLHASRVARSCRGLADYEVPETRYARGCYFSFQGPNPFRHLVYPLPVEGGLGIHATFDLAGRLRFGPDVEWIDGIDYSLDPRRAEAFYEAIRSYWPALPENSLAPDYAGIRPKLSRRGEPAADFRIDVAHASPRAGVVNLFGIESPGLTSSLAIARYVRGLVEAL